RTASERARTPAAQEHAEVGAIDNAVDVQVTATGAKPVAEEDAEIGAVNHAVVVEVTDAQARAQRRAELFRLGGAHVVPCDVAAVGVDGAHAQATGGVGAAESAMPDVTVAGARTDARH